MLQSHRAERADALVDALGGVLCEPLDDPMTAEVIAVPTRGMERWLAQRLSARLGAAGGRADGVCANVDFPFPGRLIGGVLSTALGAPAEADPWLPERSVWPLLDVLDTCLAEPWLAPLRAHLAGTPAAAGDGLSARRFSVARHVADLFDRYGVHRPELLRAWGAGRDTGGLEDPVAASARWQPELWRRLRARIGEPSPAERLDDGCARLAANPAVIDLPARLSLFGLTRLPASYLKVLEALGAGRDVHLFLLHPSPALWEAVRPRLVAGAPVRRADDPTADLPRNPLLASWGRDAREMQLVLAAAGTVRDLHHPLPRPAGGGAPPSLLERVQADVRADRPPPGAPPAGRPDRRPALDPADRSVQLHACHGRSRQVEVVRDAILHLLADDPSLEPRDVLVMCPDIERFAPLILAVFGGREPEGDRDRAAEVDGPSPGRTAPGASAGSPSRPPDLRVRLADRSLRQTNPVLGVTAELLELATARLTAGEVLGLASREPVRRRFGLDDDHLARLQRWVAGSGVRWGLDAAHRAPFRLDAVSGNTWRFGLDRVLLGVAMADEEQRLVGGTVPLDDVSSGDIALVGRLAELVERLGAAVDALRDPKPIAEWAAAIAGAVDDLAATSEREAWQRVQLDRLLLAVVAEATTGGDASRARLGLAEVRALLADRLRGRPTRASFRTGSLTACTLVPMRSVPHRVVCLLGLDDGAFPRQPDPEGDDLLARDPHVGDRDARGEDRQLLLDALLSATEHLVIAYSGRDQRTNAELPPAVPVGELLDVVRATVRGGDRIVLHHPLQPFAPRNFAPGALVGPGPWGFDDAALAGAQALAGERQPAPAFLPGPLPPADPSPVELEQLVRFVQHPVGAFLRQRLGIVLGRAPDEPSETLPIELDQLDKWALGDRLLRARLAGAPLDACEAAERARGLLPPDALADQILAELRPTVEQLAAAAETAAPPDPGEESRSVDVLVELPAGRVLVGTVPGVTEAVVRTVTYSRLAAKHRLAAWVRFLALTAARPDRGYTAITIGRGAGPESVAVCRLAPFDPGDRGRRARRALAGLVDLYDRGLREPLPLYCRTSAAFASASVRGGDPERSARTEWESAYHAPKEDVEQAHELVLGPGRTFGELLAEPPRPDELGPEWPGSEPTRFGRYALRLWADVLGWEQLTT